MERHGIVMENGRPLLIPINSICARPECTDSIGDGKKAYKMLEGIPLYKHLKSDSPESEIILYDHDYGKFAEILGKKMVNYLSKNGGFSNIFPGVSIISVSIIRSKRKKSTRRHGTEIGDIAFEISYKNGDGYGKKILIFEIKFGVSHIKQPQFTRYCHMIDKPEEYFPKADEVKVIYIFFKKIDTVGGLATYQICELNKDLVNKILQTEEQREIKITNTD